MKKQRRKIEEDIDRTRHLYRGQIAVFVENPSGFDSDFFTGVVKEITTDKVVLEKPEIGKRRRFPREKVYDADRYFNKLFNELVNEQIGEDI